MHKKITTVTIAAQAGVSQSTVSKILNNDPAISEETRKAVEAVIAATGYRRRKSSRPAEKKRFALLFCPLAEQTAMSSMSYYRAVADAAAAVLKTRGEIGECTLAAGATQTDNVKNVSGAILIGEPSVGLREKLRRQGIRYVIVSDAVTFAPEENVVRNDNFGCGMRYAEYLINEGFRRIGTLGTWLDCEWLAGVRAMMLRLGVEPQAGDHREAKNTDAAQQIPLIHAWVREGDMPPVVIVRTNDIADIFASILEINHIPAERVRLVSFSHSRPAELKRTCMLTFPERQGELAGRRLLEILDNPADLPRQILVARVLCPHE